MIDLVDLAVTLLVGGAVIGGATLVALREKSHPQMYHLKPHPRLKKWFFPSFIGIVMILTAVSFIIPAPIGAEERSGPPIVAVEALMSVLVWSWFRYQLWNHVGAPQEGAPRVL